MELVTLQCPRHGQSTWKTNRRGTRARCTHVDVLDMDEDGFYRAVCGRYMKIIRCKDPANQDCLEVAQQ